MPAESLLDFGPSTRDFPMDASPLVRSLICELEARDLRYCHWKSNVRLKNALSGHDDIDLLIDRRDALGFQAVLTELGFKLAVSRAGIGHPGVFHAFALDPQDARLLHVHAYSQIVSGDSLVKAYRLPIERDLLENTCHLHRVRVPRADVELVLFAIRVALKHSSLTEIAMVNRHYASVIDELAWLQSQCDSRNAAALCSQWFPQIDARLFHMLLDAIATGNVARRIWLGRKVAKSLRGFRRIDRWEAFIDRTQRIGALASARLRGRRDLALGTGGAIVALVGPKAVGKSTLGLELKNRLGEHLDVQRIHVGKPPATALTLPFHLAIPLARRLFPGERPGEYEKAERRAAQNPSLIYSLRMAVLAYDRRHLLRKALRASTAGTIVICDRYPSTTPGAMDSSQFTKSSQNKAASPLKRRLMEMEERFCSELPPAGLIVRLLAPLATSLLRDAERNKDGGPDANAVERRRELETSGAFGRSPIVHIDTDKPLDTTVRQVMSAVWHNL